MIPPPIYSPIISKPGRAAQKQTFLMERIAAKKRAKEGWGKVRA